MLKKVIGTPREYAALLLGNLLYGVGFNLFFRDNAIAAGGFGGLGLVVSHFLPVSVGTVVFVISLPIFFWSFRVQGAKYTLSALLSTFAFSAITDLFAFLPNVTENKLMAAICGGLLYGVAAALLVRGNVSGSGSDLLGRLLVTKYRVLSLGTFVFLTDAVVILLSLAAFRDLETSIYAVATIFIMTYVTDWMINGFNRAYLFQIITNADPAFLSEKIYERLNRGVTLLPAKGMYRQEERNLLLVVVSPRQVYTMKDIIKEYAPDAFVVLTSATEILGEGFHGVDVAVPIKELEHENDSRH